MPQTSSTRQTPFICRNNQMILQSWGLSEMDKKQSTRMIDTKLVDRFVAWCGNEHLILNMNKTNEMIVDFKGTDHAFKSCFFPFKPFRCGLYKVELQCYGLNLSLF
ncbi:hypothetical protein GOODEAATRI_034445 [Goodea atripinnis]|uniref:Uncharacterized protein n=1 Tax=Goodea atripinnis TaxID=208336 RepID=A0ABV0P015_9TELE